MKHLIFALLISASAHAQTYTRTIDTIDCNRCYGRDNVMIAVNAVKLYRQGKLIETWKYREYYSGGKLWKRECELIPVSAFKPSR